MKRKLFTQIRNEWRDNIWMILELAIVTGAIWVILALCWETSRAKFIPKGYDTSDTFATEIKWVAQDSPEFDNTDHAKGTDYLNYRNALLQNLRNHPLVEAAGLGENALPYNMSAINTSLVLFDSHDTIHYGGNQRRMSPDLVRAFRLKSLTGKSEEQLMEMLRNGKILISDNIRYTEDGRNPFDLIGKRMVFPYDSAHVMEVGDVISHMRRNEFEFPFGGTILQGISEDQEWASELVIRVKEGRGDEFIETINTSLDLRKFGNVYLSDIRSFSDMRRTTQHEYVTALSSRLMLAFFLLVVIFLGLLGTFWFRMQQRVGEVAIRMVCGATRSEIFRRVISEGLILHLFGVVLISAVLWPFKSKLDAIDWVSVLVCELAAILLVALGVVVSLWWPARRIMKIEPAVAVKEE